MRITDYRKNNKKECFSQLRAGDVFLDEDGDINIKVEDENTCNCHAVMLENGQLWTPCDSLPVIKLNARTVVED